MLTESQVPQYAPIRQALGSDWSALGLSIRRHYDLPLNTNKQLSIEGTMDVSHSVLGKVFITISRLFNALVPYKGHRVPVTVSNWTEPGSEAMFWHRTFMFPGKKPVVFRSRMEFAGGNEIVEYVKFGLGIRMTLSAEGETLRYDSCGYRWRLGPLRLNIPDWLLLGTATIREIPTGGNTFKVEFDLNHPLWRRPFGYSGQFALCEFSND